MARLTYLLAALVLIPFNYAHALQINQQGADTLKASFQDLLDYQKTVNDALGSVRIEYKGDLTVKQEATYYAVTFPHVFIRGPKIEGVPEDNTVFDMGVIKINAIPDDKPGYWKTVMTFPSKMTLKGEKPEDNFSINFADQKSIALFSERLGYFTKLDMNLSGISFQAAGQDVGVNIGGLQGYMKFEEKGDGTFSGPGHVLLTNLNIAPPTEAEKFSIGEFKADFSMQDMKMPTLKEYQDKLMKHAKTFESLQNLGSPEKEVEMDGNAILNMMMDLYNFDMNGFTFEYSAKDINVSSDLENQFRDFDTLQIGSASLGFGFQNLKSEKGTMAIKSAYDTINITPVDPEYKDVMPQKMDMNIQALNIPYGALTQIATNTAKAIATDPESAQMAGLGVLMRLPAILAQAGSQIVVEKNGASNSIYEFGISGKVMTDLSAMSGFTAQFNALFEGLDALHAIVKKNAANTSSPNAGQFAQMANTLASLKAVGKAQKGPNGKPAYAYDIQANAQGQFLVNGQDAATVFSPAPPPQ